MITSVEDWVLFLKNVHLAGGFPLVGAGLVLMLFGWRMWKVCVVMAFATVGAVLAARMAGPGPNQWIAALIGAVLLGGGSFFPVKHAICVLGGILMLATTYYYVSDLHLDTAMLYAVMVIAFFGGFAYSVINRRRVVIFVTSFLGAVLLMSGLMVWLTSMPALFGTFRSLASSSVIVVPFVLLVPTVMSAFYQIAEVHRLQIDL